MRVEKKLMNSLEKELKLSDEQLEVIGFGYRLFIHTIWGYFFIILFAYLFGTLQATLTATITASLFRIFSGGAHASTQKRCIAIGTIIFNVLGFIANISYRYVGINLLKQFSWVIAAVALMSFILYAPADTEGKPITSKIQKGKLKGISISLLVVWFVLFNFVIKGEINIYRQYLLATSLGLAWQSISLWPHTYRWIIFK